jgi:hypothetical protein
VRLEVTMTRSRRLSIALAVFAALFLAVAGYAVSLLWSLNDPLLTALAAFAGLVCIAATGATWWIARALDDDEQAHVPFRQAPAPAQAAIHTQARIDVPPVTELPAAYVAAVMKGARANQAAFKAQSAQA